MDSTVGKLMSYIIAIAVMFIGIPIIVLTQLDETKETYIKSEVQSFVDECLSTGQISANDYETFSGHIYKMGKYDISIVHGAQKAYYREDGSVELSTESVSEGIIFDEMYALDGRNPQPYRMKNGDTLYVTVKKAGKSISDSALSVIGISATKSLVDVYGGIVGATPAPYIKTTIERG